MYAPAVQEAYHYNTSREDPIFFINHFIYLDHPVQGPVPFLLTPDLETVIRSIHEGKFTITLGEYRG